MNIEKISLATGLPCMYIEDEIPKLIFGEIISEAKGGYISNIIIHSEETTRNIEILLLKHSLNLTAATEKALNDNDTRIKEIGFYGGEESNDSLWWSLIPMLLREACEEARRQNGHVAKPVFPPRRDGGRGWIFVNVSPDEKHKYISGYNGYFLDNSRFLYYWSGKYYNDELVSFLRKLENCRGLTADFSVCGFDDLMTGECIKYGLARKENDIIKWSIPIFTSEQYQKLENLIAEFALPLAGMILPVVDKIYVMMKSEIPKQLHDQIKGVFGAELNSVIAMVCDKLEEQGKLVSPGDEYFTKQIIMILK